MEETRNIREEYKNRLAKINEILESSEGSEDDYVVDSVCQIYKALIENDQFSDVTVDRPTYASKLIRCYRYIPNVILDLKGVKRILIGGMYTMAEVCLIPKELLDKATHGNAAYGRIENPEMYGLPSFSEVNYATRKILNNHLAVVLKKGTWTDDEVWTASQYDYVTLS